jgi:hypothetical protein
MRSRSTSEKRSFLTESLYVAGYADAGTLHTAQHAATDDPPSSEFASAVASTSASASALSSSSVAPHSQSPPSLREERARPRQGVLRNTASPSSAPSSSGQVKSVSFVGACHPGDAVDDVTAFGESEGAAALFPLTADRQHRLDHGKSLVAKPTHVKPTSKKRDTTDDKRQEATSTLPPPPPPPPAKVLPPPPPAPPSDPRSDCAIATSASAASAAAAAQLERHAEEEEVLGFGSDDDEYHDDTAGHW